MDINRLVFARITDVQGYTSAIDYYVVVDAYFSKLTFVNDALEMGFHVISRLRDNAYFHYLIKDKPAGGKGRPKLYDEKIDIEHLKEDRFEVIPLKDRQGRILSAIVHLCSLKRKIRLCIWESEDKKVRKLYFSTDTQMKARAYWIITRLVF